MYFLLTEFNKLYFSIKIYKYEKLIKILISLFYSTSPIIFNSLFVYKQPLTSCWLIIYFPLVLGLSFRYFFYDKYILLIYFFIIQIIFSVSVNLLSIGFILPFIVLYFSLIIFFYINLKININKLLLKFSLLSIVLLGASSFHLIDNFIGLYNNYFSNEFTDQVNDFAYNDEINSGYLMVSSLINHLNVVFPILNLPQIFLAEVFDPGDISSIYYLWQYKLTIGFLFIFIYMCNFYISADISKKHKIFFFLFIIYILISIGNFPIWRNIYLEFYKLPLTVVLRSFYLKFSPSLLIFYSIILNTFFILIFDRSKFKKLLILIFVFSLIMQSIPILNKSILLKKIPYQDQFNMGLTKLELLKMNKFYLTDLPDDLIIFPPNNENYLFHNFEFNAYAGVNFYNFISNKIIISGLGDQQNKKYLYDELLKGNSLTKYGISHILVRKDWLNQSHIFYSDYVNKNNIDFYNFLIHLETFSILEKEYEEFLYYKFK